MPSVSHPTTFSAHSKYPKPSTGLHFFALSAAVDTLALLDLWREASDVRDFMSWLYSLGSSSLEEEGSSCD